MILPPLFEFGKLTVADSGIPGKERIIFRPTERINMAQCGLLLGWRLEDGVIIPLNDYFYWFGDFMVAPPGWIIVYTGKGTPNVQVFEGQNFYWHYWGREYPLFTCSNQIPLLIKFPGVQIGEHLNALTSFEDQQKQLQLPSSP